ncbi:hypothetical protein PGTUg99_008264 [Puccinia graminis f. sp. tritici]|uniref:Uncharacterized protein n=1 Tax=Puccinia graminis f. sp. tritici TaxID=56615 RepID=A0A5B0S0A1_PUCGR|nr:hypothetical protein PGTUg99_008264 [Puccinia graminis f. sp. tritici]
MDSDREVVVSGPRSMAMSEAPESTTERTRFARLNPEIEQGIADRLFSTFVDIYGCMQKFNNQLETILGRLFQAYGEYTAVAGRWQKSPKFGRQIAGPRPPGPDRSKTGLRSAGKRTVNVPTTLPASFWANCRQNLGPIAGHGNMPSNPSQGPQFRWLRIIHIKNSTLEKEV